MYSFLASFFSQDIEDFNYIGLVTPNQMVLACRNSGVVLQTMPDNNAPAAAQLITPVAASEGHPVLILRVSQVAGAFGRDVFHVHQVNNPAAPLPPPLVAPQNQAGVPVVIGFTPTFLTSPSFSGLLRAVPRSFGPALNTFLNVGRFSAEAIHYHQVLGIPLPATANGNFVPLPQVHLAPHTFTYTSEFAPADVLASDLRDNPSVWLVRESDSSLPADLRSRVRYSEPRSIKMTTLVGVPGCGKTFAAKNLVYANRHEVSWAFPSEVVAATAQASGSLPLDKVDSHHYLEGFEIFRKAVCSTLVLDDFTRFPPGTIDFLIAVHPHLEHIILTGDPAQSNAVFPVDTGKSRVLDGIAVTLLRRYPGIPYATVTRRLSVGCADLLGLTTLSTRVGHYLFTSRPPPNIPLFVTSPRFAQTKSLGGTTTFVIASSQGLDIAGDTCLDLGGMSNTIADSPAVVGLTRSQGNCFLNFDQAALAPRAGIWGSSTIISTMVALSASTGHSLLTTNSDPGRLVARAFAEHVRSSVPSLRSSSPALPLIGALADHLPSLPSRKGFSSAQASSALAFTFPVLSKLPRPSATLANSLHDPPVPDVPSDPLLHFEGAQAKDRFSREKGFRGVLSNQFPERKHPGAMHHRHGDLVTEKISYAKRLKTASPAANEASLRGASRRTNFQQLRRGFLNIFPEFRNARDFSALFEECSEHALDTWASKRTLSDINKSLRKDQPDAPLEFTRTFLKSQVIRKTEKWFGDASPGQIVTEFPLFKTLRDNTFASALERIVLEECPEHVYLHLRRSTSDLSSWVSKYLRGVSRFTETDYTSWDSSIDGPFIEFDCWLLTQIGAPSHYIETYRHEACNTRYFGGNLRLMQHSGNRYTFLLNTLRNLALTNASYAGISKTPQAFGGDDSLIADQPLPAPGFKPQAWLCSPRIVHTEIGHLFGHLISDGFLSYDYEYMANRLSVAIVERPFDVDFFRSFIDQMVALPYTASSHYAKVYDMLHSHCRLHNLVIPGLSPPGGYPVSFVPHSIYQNGIFPKSQTSKGWDTA
jgi:hypothetical protein